MDISDFNQVTGVEAQLVHFQLSSQAHTVLSHWDKAVTAVVGQNISVEYWIEFSL